MYRDGKDDGAAKAEFQLRSVLDKNLDEVLDFEHRILNGIRETCRDKLQVLVNALYASDTFVIRRQSQHENALLLQSCA